MDFAPVNENVGRLALVPSTIAPDPVVKPAEQPATIWLRGEIGANKSISLENVRRDVSALNNPAHIRMAICSSGGNISEARKIYNFLRALPMPVSAQAVEYVVSAGVFVFLAASYRKMIANVELLIHATRQDVKENNLTARDFRRRAEDLEKNDRETVDFLSARTGCSPGFFEEQMEHENSLSPFEALDSGIVHEIEGLTPRCSLAWAAQAKEVAAAGMIVPSHFLTANYFAACATASLLTERRERC